MSLDKKQWAGVIAVLGGMITLPVVFAMGDAPEQEILANKIQYGNGGVPIEYNIASGTATFTSGSKVTTYRDPNNPNTQIVTNMGSNNSPMNSQGPAATRSNLQQQPVNFTNNNTQQVAYNQAASCSYYSEAGNLGIYHFAFPEAPESDLVTINGYKVHKDAANDLRRMIDKARVDGVTLTIGSAFRSKSYQAGIVQRKKAAGQSTRQIYYVSSHPGFSEHHTGFAIDFTPISHAFANTPGFAWLKNNASKYGFEQTFTSTYSAVTGVSQESWHWKFTKSPTAQQMLANSNCYAVPKSQWRAS